MPSQPPHSFSDDQVLAALRARMPPLYFVNTPLARMRRDLDCLQRLPAEGLALDFYRAPGAVLTELTLCAYDAAEAGLLANVSGALLDLGISIHTAFITTLPDADVPSRRIALDTLLVSETYCRRARPLGLKKQENARAELSRVLRGDHEYAQRKRHAVEPAELYKFSARNEGGFTIIKVGAQDHAGVLFRMTTALAALSLCIVQGQVNTFESALDDLFYVVGTDGEPLNRDELQKLEGRLRALLQQ